MARHSQARSLPSTLALAAVVTLVALLVAFGVGYVMLSDDGTSVGLRTESPTAPPTAATTDPMVLPTQTAPTVAPPTTAPAPTATAPASPTAAPAEDVTVQVLDAAEDDDLVDDVVEVLEGYGYQVVAVHPAIRIYEETTVFFSEGHQADAEALRARDPRFVEIGPNPNLSEDVDIHVVVGVDWAPAG